MSRSRPQDGLTRSQGGQGQRQDRAEQRKYGVRAAPAPAPSSASAGPTARARCATAARSSSSLAAVGARRWFGTSPPWVWESWLSERSAGGGCGGAACGGLRWGCPTESVRGAVKACGESAAAEELGLGRDRKTLQTNFLRAAWAKPAGAPHSYACAVPDGDVRPLHLAVREVHEVDTGRAANCGDPVATQKGHTRRRSGFRCIVGGERAERVVRDSLYSLAHRRLAGNALRDVHAMA